MILYVKYIHLISIFYGIFQKGFNKKIAIY